MAVALTWSLRAIGLVSVFVLARLLTPADFGVVGLAMTAVAMVEIFSLLGLRQALLRLEDPSRNYYDTAWTIQLVVFVVLGIALCAVAAPAAAFYEEPRVEPVIYALALRFVMLGLTNIGVVEFDRTMDFGRDLKMRATARVVSFFVTVGLALWLASYWALVAGMIVQSVMLAGMSYTMQPFRPRFSLAKRAELLGVSLWIFAGVASQIVYSQIERITVGRTADTGMVGAFAVGKDVSNILTQEIATALNRVTFVQTARSGAFTEQGERIAKSLGGYAMMAAPMGLGLAAVADDFIAVFLGNQWDEAVPLVAPIAVASALMAVYKLVASSLQAGGHERVSALTSLVGTVVLASVIGAVAVRGGSPLAIAQAGLAVTILLAAASLWVIGHFSRMPAWRYLLATARPFGAGAAMYGILTQLPALSVSPIVELAWRGPLGAVLYFAVLGLLWVVSGRPDSAERALATFIGQRFARG